MINTSRKAISPELRFIAINDDFAYDIRWRNVKVDKEDKRLVDSVYQRAEADALELLHQMRSKLADALDGLMRVDKGHVSRDRWDTWCTMFPLRGRKINLGYVGVHIGAFDGRLRLTGFVKPRGGSHALGELERAFRKSGHSISRTRNDPTRPDWVDCLVWLDKNLTTCTTMQELQMTVFKEARSFFKSAQRLFESTSSNYKNIPPNLITKQVP